MNNNNNKKRSGQQFSEFISDVSGGDSASTSVRRKLLHSFSNDEEEQMILFGIFDSSISNPSCSKLIACKSSDNFYDFADILCSKILSTIRSESVGYGINQHLWFFQIGKAVAEGTKLRTKWTHKICDEIDSHQKGKYYSNDEDNMQQLHASQMMRSFNLTEQHHCQFEYDLGTTTTIFMKVLSIGSLDGDKDSYPQMVDMSGPITDAKRNVLLPLTADNVSAASSGFNVCSRIVTLSQRPVLLQQLASFSTPMEQQIDSLFPHFSNAVLKGKHLGFTLGLLNMIASVKDSIFCSMESGSHAENMFSNYVFRSMDEFFLISEQAWTPGQVDTQKYREEWICRHIAPADIGRPEQESYEHSKKASLYGPKTFFFRFGSTAERDDAINSLHQLKGFSFASMFPRTFHFLSETCSEGRFRWFSYKEGVLRVCVGRSAGIESRECPVSNVLREWQGGAFTSFHELMCAVECSWVLPGGSATNLGDQWLEIDRDNGPKYPPSLYSPPVIFEATDVTVLRPFIGGKSSIVSLIFGARNGGSHWLYVGERCGRISKWDLNTNTEVASVSAFSSTALVNGVDNKLLGLLVNPSGNLLFSWSYNDDVIRQYTCSGQMLIPACSLGLNAGGGVPAHPAVVVCSTGISSGYFANASDVLFVGLNAFGETENESSVDDPSELASGNILVVLPRADNVLLRLVVVGCFRGHGSPICALALVDDGDRLLSISHDLQGPDEIILWKVSDTDRPSGHIIRRFPVPRPIPKYFTTPQGVKKRKFRIDNVSSLSVHSDGSNNAVVLLCNYGQHLVVFDLEAFKIVGKRNIGLSDEDSVEDFIATMAVYGSTIVPMNQGKDKVLLIDSTHLCGVFEGSIPSDTDEYGDDDDDDSSSSSNNNGDNNAGSQEHPLHHQYRKSQKDVKIAEGLARFPQRDKKKPQPPPPPGDTHQTHNNSDEDDDDDEDEDGLVRDFDFDDGHAFGVRVAALNGTHLVGGYSDGSLRVFPVSSAAAGWLPNGGGRTTPTPTPTPSCYLSSLVGDAGVVLDYAVDLRETETNMDDDEDEDDG